MGVSGKHHFQGFAASNLLPEPRTFLLPLRPELDRRRIMQFVSFATTRLFFHCTWHLACIAVLATLL